MRPSASAVPAESGRRRSRDLAWIFLAVFAAYATAIPGDFVWLDHVEIEQGGYRIVAGSDWLRVWTLPLDRYLHRDSGLTEVGGGYWRPIYAISLSLDWGLWGGRAWLYHLENILWHLLVVIGLYALGRRLLARHPSGGRIAFWAALLFAVHPLGVHSVTWISGRKDLMCAAFGVASLLAFFETLSDRGVPAGGGRHRPVLGIALAAALLVLSVGSKELGFLVPLAATVLLPWMPMSPDPLTSRSARRRRLMSLGILWGCALGLAAFRAGVVGVVGLNAERPSDSLLENLATHATLWWHYVRLVLLPGMPSISDGWPIAKQIGAVEILAILGVAGSIPLLAYAVHRRWFVAPPLLWFVVWMIPSMGLLPLRHVRAERYLYPASWGLLVAALLLLAYAWPALRARGLQRGVTMLASGLAFAFILTTAYANPVWWDDASLFEHTVGRDPRYVEGRVGLARLALDRGDYEMAVEHSRRALAEASDRARTAYCPWFVAHTNLGLALLYLDRTVGARLEFEEALRRRPNHAVAHYHLGLLALQTDQLDDARERFQRALALDPGDPLALSNLAATHLRSGEWTEALDLLFPLVERAPDDPVTLRNLTAALLSLGRFEQAEPFCEQMVRLAPNDPEPLAKLAWARWGNGRRADAIATWRRARALSPNHPAVRGIGQILGQP